MHVVIDLIRHAESRWVERANASPVACFGGRMTEIALSDTGRIQATQLGLYAKRHDILPTAFCASPAKRARETHQLSSIARFGVHRSVELDPRLHELDWGKWTGQPRGIVDARPFQRARARAGLRFTPPGGESYDEVGRRVREYIREMARSMGGGHLWVFTHKNAIVGAVQPFMRWSWEQARAASVGLVTLTRLEFDGRNLKLVFFNQPTLG